MLTVALFGKFLVMFGMSGVVGILFMEDKPVIGSSLAVATLGFFIVLFL